MSLSSIAYIIGHEIAFTVPVSYLSSFFSLNSTVFYCYRLGPPDFHPQTPNCPEETLTREYVQSGYRETVEGLEVGFTFPHLNNHGIRLSYPIFVFTYISVE